MVSLEEETGEFWAIETVENNNTDENNICEDLNNDMKWKEI